MTTSNTPIAGINLKVAVTDTDYYALQSLNSYLAWDRRTRVILLAASFDALYHAIDRLPDAELPDVAVIDSDAHTPEVLGEAIRRLRARVPSMLVLCLARVADVAHVEAAAEAGARGYLLKSDLTHQIAWAVVYALDRDFLITSSIERACARSMQRRIRSATVLPRPREYPELTDRIRQAIELCVVKGMPAHLAADEMGISLHTVRSYIKEGYRILESYDETVYPKEMSPQEKAFMRITRIEDEAD
jgi:DNA-binding NarL/FixJ family response regulator